MTSPLNTFVLKQTQTENKTVSGPFQLYYFASGAPLLAEKLYRDKNLRLAIELIPKWSLENSPEG